MRSNLLLLICVCGAFAQPPGEIKPAAVEGIVTNALTGEPILRAHVTLRGAMPIAGTPPQSYGALTDVEGKFRIASLTPGGYGLWVEKTGFLMPVEGGGSGRSNFVTLAPGDSKSDVKLKLVPTGAITGRVLDALGEPVEGVQVSASGPTTMNGGTTDEQGRFRLGGLAAGRYRVCAESRRNSQSPPEIRTDGTKELHYSGTCYPDTLSGKAKPAVDVSAGSESSGIEIRLLQTPNVRVSGRVTGIPAGHRVMVMLGQGMSSRSGGAVKADGTFEVWGIDPGHYTVRANGYPMTPAGGGAGIIAPSDIQSMPRSASVEVDVDTANVDHVELTMMAPFDISGQLEFDDEEARPPKPPQPRVAQVQPGPPMMMARQLILSALDGSMMLRPVTIAEDGSFKLEKVQPDQYRVRVSWQTAYVRSMRLGPMSVEGGILDLRNGGAGMPLNIQVSSALAEVSGKIEGDPAATAGKSAALLPQERGGLPQPRVARATNGSYSFRVEPGKYLLFLVDESEWNAVMQSRYQGLDAIADRAEKLDLRPRDKVTKDLK